MVRGKSKFNLPAIALARAAAACLFFIFVGLLVWRGTLSSRAQKLETRWSQSLQQPTLIKREALKRSLIAEGCQVTPEGGASRVVFQGSHAQVVSVVNRLLAEPYAWSSWSGEKVSPTRCKANIVVSSL